MAISSKEIGWSQESNLLWQIARQIQHLTQVTGTIIPSPNIPTLDQVLTSRNTSLLNAKIGDLGLWQPDIDNGDGTFGSYGVVRLRIGATNTVSVVDVTGAGLDTPSLFSSSDDGTVHFKYAHHNPTFKFNDISQDRVWKWQDVDGTVALIQGKIKLSDPSQSRFDDLTNARSYVSGFTSATITDESFDSVTHTYSFTVPAGSAFNNANSFCSDSQMNFQDPEGLVVTFGEECFGSNETGNIFGNITAGIGFLNASSGNNTMGNVVATSSFLKLSTGNNTTKTINVGVSAFLGASPSIKNTIYKIESCGINFANGYAGRMDVGLFGNNGTANLPTDIFTTSNLAWINTPYSNEFINSGGDDADILQAKANMTYQKSAINYEGIDKTNLSYTPSPTNGVITNDNGADATLPLADGTNAGLLKPSKFTVLENTSGANSGDNSPNINSNAYANSLDSNNVKTGSTAGGDLAGTFPNPTVLNSAILTKVLTGLNITGSLIVNTDTLLQAFGKLQNQVNLVNAQKGVNNATTTVLTSAQLNSQYPSATADFTVYCTSIIAGSMVYRKTPTQWIGITVFTP